jgi:NAD(P)H dehydrogenase (quinone)
MKKETMIMTTNRTETESLVLVTGATGNTGAPVVEQLIEHGYPVRAFVHRIDERSDRLQALGAEVVQGDFLDLASVRSAMVGVKGVYFCYPPFDGLLEATANIAEAVRDAGVEAVVNMSQLTAREGAPSQLSRQHWLSERILDWANIGAAHVRPGFFAEDLYLFTGDSIAADGRVYLPYGDGKHAPVAAVDIARVVVAILEDPQPHVGSRYFLTGPKNMKMAEMAKILSDELGKPVEYVDLPVEHWRQALLAKPEFSEFLAHHLVHVAHDHQDGVFSTQTDLVEKIGGRKPQSLQEFVRANVTMFTSQAKKAA